MAENSHFKNLALLGCGNMGGALLRGIAESGLWDKNCIRIYDVDRVVCVSLAERFGVAAASNIEELVQDADALISAVKPQNFPQAAQALISRHHNCGYLISIMAGLTSAKISMLVKNKFKVIRTMPNLPLSVSAGATAIATDGLSSEIIASVEEIFSSVGKTVRVTENLMDAVTGLSGSGPMYVFEFIGALISAGVESGLSADVSRDLAVQSVKGAVELLNSGSESTRDWTKKVCSPGGTTLAALEVLNQHEFSSVIEKAVAAAVNRSRELGR